MRWSAVLLGGIVAVVAIWASVTAFEPSAPASVLGAPASTAPDAGVETETEVSREVRVVEAESARRPAASGDGQRPVSMALPVGVVIPKVEIESDLEELGLTAEGSVAAPEDYARAGWFAAGIRPGQRGPAVIAGHLDSTTGPAVFSRLGELVPGDEVFVDREDGQRLRFVVTRTEQVSKGAFPTHAVYGPTTGAELRLVTCGGVFDRSTRHYLDNIVVYAELA